ncbi:hypothetical protein BJF95_13370 [Rhizobium oryziradicis]|uniref:Uncharacterized protein n=1 Tax=Rhizobium oryziradicis TaxID=1867956 RepID=A0A1Q8ZKK3_9HYPH|nr:hypothetical protein BJF95_13370 [Rhizobium oryziradicis]
MLDHLAQAWKVSLLIRGPSSDPTLKPTKTQPMMKRVYPGNTDIGVPRKIIIWIKSGEFRRNVTNTPFSPSLLPPMDKWVLAIQVRVEGFIKVRIKIFGNVMIAGPAQQANDFFKHVSTLFSVSRYYSVT